MYAWPSHEHNGREHKDASTSLRSESHRRSDVRPCLNSRALNYAISLFTRRSPTPAGGQPGGGHNGRPSSFPTMPPCRFSGFGHVFLSTRQGLGEIFAAAGANSTTWPLRPPAWSSGSSREPKIRPTRECLDHPGLLTGTEGRRRWLPRHAAQALCAPRISRSSRTGWALEGHSAAFCPPSRSLSLVADLANYDVSSRLDLLRAWCLVSSAPGSPRFPSAPGPPSS